MRFCQKFVTANRSKIAESPSVHDAMHNEALNDVLTGSEPCKWLAAKTIEGEVCMTRTANARNFMLRLALVENRGRHQR